MFKLYPGLKLALELILATASISRVVSEKVVQTASNVSAEMIAKTDSKSMLAWQDKSIQDSPMSSASSSRPFCYYHSTDSDLSIFNPSRMPHCVKMLDFNVQKRILVTGGFGFVGSHLVDSLLLDGHKVIVVDNLSSGRRKNLDHWSSHNNLTTIEDNVSSPTWMSHVGQLNQIYHLASPASPKHYLRFPIQTIQVNTLGTMHVLELAHKNKARVVIASTSEIYGSPLEHPQVENYWGNVNPVGPRSCYDESKRLAEAAAVAYRDQRNVSIGIARIFNTYGPRMRPNDGRVVSNFIFQALKNASLTVYGDGSQTRSFQYISDLVDGLKRLMSSTVMTPVNLGNPSERRIIDLATYIRNLLCNPSPCNNLIFQESPVDDPPRRRPNISLAQHLLNWEPRVDLLSGLNKTIDYFKRELTIT